MTSYTLLLLGLRLTKLNKVVPFFLLTNFVKCLNCTVNAILTFFWKESFFFLYPSIAYSDKEPGKTKL